MRKLLLTFACLALASPRVVAAQAVIAYFTLIETPPGALPPVLSSVMVDRSLTEPDVTLRFGHLSQSPINFNAFDLRLGIPAGPTAQIGLTAGYQSVSCTSGCGDASHFIAGANAEGRIARSVIGSGSDAAVLTVGVNGELGFGKPKDGTLLSLTAGLPIALVSGGSSSLKIAPFMTPSIGWGRASGGGNSESAVRFLLGGGVAVIFPTTGVTANFGFQKVL